MPRIVMYTTGFCPYCIGAKKLLDHKNAAYEEIRVDKDRSKRDEMMARSNRRTVPQIFIGDIHVGGHDDLVALEQTGELDPMLQAGSDA